MADRQKMLRAVARQVAAERVDAPSPRPPSARILLPRQHEADLAAGRTHRLRLTASTIDVDRLAAALQVAAERHDALRLQPVRDSGRCFLGDVDDPVARVDSLDELGRADPLHPVRWALDGATVTIAVSAYLMDRSCWGSVLTTVEAAYHKAAETLPSPELDYGDYCYWLAHRSDPDPVEVSYPETEPYWAFASDQPWGVVSRSVPPRPGTRSAVLEEMAIALADALRSCGWQSSDVPIRRSQPRQPDIRIVGRVDADPHRVCTPGTETGPRACPECTVDVIDLPGLRFDDEVVVVEPVLEPSPGWQCLLVRQPDGGRVYLAGGELTLPALHDALAGDVAGGNEWVVATTAARSTVPSPGIVTSRRTLAADVVSAAADRRAAELRDAGVLPGCPVVIEATEAPETVANLIAALKCRADVLLLDLEDPPAWRSGLLALVPDAVLVSSHNVVQATAPPKPTGDGEGALLLGLSSAPGPPVLARVPLDDLLHGASALGELSGPCVVNAAGAGEDLALKALAADLVLVGSDGHEAVDLVTQVPGSCVERQLAEDWAAPLHQLTDVTWLDRGTSVAEGTVTRWWVAEAPAAQWLATENGLRLLSGTARLVDDAGRTMPDGTVGELAVRVPSGSRYVDDPRRTAERMRPGPGGVREFRTDVLGGNRGSEFRLLRFAADRAVDRNRTCLVDAWRACAPDAVVGVRPERVFVVSPRPVDAVELPGPLAAALVRVDPSATDLDTAGAWQLVQARARQDDAPEAWATPEEAALAEEVVEPVLGMPVRRNDDLFSLGATSLQLMRVLLQVKERFGVEVPLARFFAAPTVRVLSELISETTDPAAAALDVLREIEGEDP